VVQNHGSVSEGAIVGISFGWLIAVVGFYVLGVCIICRCLPKAKDDDVGPYSDKDKSSSERPKEDSLKAGRRRKQEVGKSSITNETKEARRRRLPEHDPTTLELAEQ
jgi:hypothetical protein